MLFYEHRVLGCKVETTPGTKESLSASDAAMNVYDADITPMLQWEERKSQGGFGLLRSYHTGQVGKATFKMDLVYDGTTIPTYLDTKLFPGCGVTKTTTTFAPKLQAPDAGGADVKCLTIGLWVDGKFACIYGAAGNCKIEMKTAQIVTLSFEFTGILDVEADVAIVTPTYPDENLIKVRAANGSVTYDAVEMCMESLTLDFGCQVIGKKCINAAKGYDFFMVADFMPKITGNPESKLVASQDWLTMMLASEAEPLICILPGADVAYTAGEDDHNLIMITAPKAQLKNKKQGNREGIAIDDLEFDCCINTADSNNQFKINFIGDAA